LLRNERGYDGFVRIFRDLRCSGKRGQPGNRVRGRDIEVAIARACEGVKDMDFSARRIDDFARRHPRLVTIALMVSSAGLLATSSDGPNDYRYDFDLAGPLTRVELTDTAPSAVVRVNVRAHALGTADIATTENSTMRLNGSLSFVGVDPVVAPSVSVRIGATSAESEVLVVSSSFYAARELEFTGDCSTFLEDDPCIAVATIELSRTDAGTSGGTVFVNLRHDFAKSAPKSDSPNERVRLPWSVEVTSE
jgi:hypothetical protein